MIAVAVLVAAGLVWAVDSRVYRVGVVLASATNLHEGGEVTMNGFPAGKVESISVQDGKAMLRLALDEKSAPLHDGAKVTVEWKALLGERWVEIKDGAPANAAIPDGGMLPGSQIAPTNLDDVLAALDKPTREHLSSLVNQLDQTVHGNERNASDTLRAAGPALSSLGQVLSGIGRDGPAVRDLVTQVNSMVGTLSKHDGDVRAIIDSLSKTTALTVQQRQQLASTLKQLPGTLDTANRVLGTVPATADKAVPLLQDLQPATQQLPSVARKLSPVLQQIPPLLDKLAPTLAGANQLLDATPGLLDVAHQTVPGVAGTASYLGPVLNYLRPFTPELAGWVSEWSSNGGNYDANGHFVRFYLQEGATTFADNPGVLPPGTQNEPYPLPGANANQPWKDAWGSGVR
ncbi:MAG TPA: MlaD family protein [Amycolatopsis sp.]|uniref:MlaD family protein n=1 Tax=unclassified Amycolatopsis TaxID=2618356 RepID=UPI00106EA880|nr:MULTISPECIES: MlaD family protein [unclassified Amycolatopsis]HWD05779.1 MlaD family protein [Amycolatopsis sp.]